MAVKHCLSALLVWLRLCLLFFDLCAGPRSEILVESVCFALEMRRKTKNPEVGHKVVEIGRGIIFLCAMSSFRNMGNTSRSFFGYSFYFFAIFVDFFQSGGKVVIG